MPIITLDLNQNEYNDVWGWVNYYRAHPQFIGVPDGEWHDGNPDYQTKIVLSDSTRARFDQLNAQFPGSGGAPVPPGDPLARVKSAPSQWAKWFGLSDAEATALIDQKYLTREQKNQNNNWWGLYGVKGRYDAASNRYLYYTYPGGVETTHVDTGGADAATEKASGQDIPGPKLP